MAGGTNTRNPRLGGVIHTYQKYDPTRFPPPGSPGQGDMASAAFEHMMRFGSRRRLTEEDLRNAVHIDVSQIAGMGPSLDALIEMLEERKRKILETYDPEPAHKHADREFERTADGAREAEWARDLVDEAVRDRQIVDLEKLWYLVEKRDPSLAAAILRTKESLGTLYEIDELASKYAFTGREAMDVPKALEIKEELETIDRLLEQLKEAMKNAQIAVIDLDELQRFVDEADIDQLRGFERQIAEHVRRMAEEEGLVSEEGSIALSPKAYRIFQSKLLDEIFSELQAAASGRHTGPIVGEGVVEMDKTRAYEFGDSPSHIDVPRTLINAAARAAKQGGRFGARMEDIEVHLTRNNPKCATTVLMDMSGSMRHFGQYVNCKRMALALQGLIQSEYPGDFLRFIEIFSLAKMVDPGRIVELMPKPVTIHEPWVRLKADLSDPRVSETMIPPHFTNIQQGLSLSRRLLAAQDTPNRQILLITDGLPTAHVEADEQGRPQLYLLYPPDPLTERATMREAFACQREGITINIFLLPSWSQDEDDIAFAHRLAEQTAGRVFFTGGDDLDRFVLWDYVAQRRKIIG